MVKCISGKGIAAVPLTRARDTTSSAAEAQHLRLGASVHDAPAGDERLVEGWMARVRVLLQVDSKSFARVTSRLFRMFWISMLKVARTRR
jgi:hypothetical protein